MWEKSYEIADGSLYYKIIENRVHITQFSGLAYEVTVPERIEDLPVCVIEKKAFLSRKNLRRVILPASLETLGDWAFAYCGRLEEVKLGSRRTVFGKSVFLDCAGLKRITMTEEHNREDTSFPAELLAATEISLDASYLLEPAAAGSREWYAKWDARLMTLMNTPDDNGYSKQVLCGEEDYGSTDLNAFMSGSRRKKAGLAMLRLLYPERLSEKNKAFLTDFLLSHTKGCEREEAWQVINTMHGDDRQYYTLFAETGCVTPSNIDGILTDIGETHPEMKAYFIKVCSDNRSEGDFFDDLDL